MWPRVVEIMLGFWLILSPFIFGHLDGLKIYWTSDFICASLAIIISSLSLWQRIGRIHLATIAVALWLLGFGFLEAPYPTPPYLQNDIVLGLLLLITAIIPNHANSPPESWQELFHHEGKKAASIVGS